MPSLLPELSQGTSQEQGRERKEMSGKRIKNMSDLVRELLYFDGCSIRVGIHGDTAIDSEVDWKLSRRLRKEVMKLLQDPGDVKKVVEE